MAIRYLVAAALVVAIGFAHSYLGERYILTRLFRRSDLPRIFGSSDFTVRTLRFAWHITTVAWFGLATILVLLAKSAATTGNIAIAIGWTFLASGLIALVASRGRHLSWVVFFAIGCLAIYGTHK